MTSFESHHHRLPNGLQLVVSPDRVAPVVAVNLWYDVGSRHEWPGRTGLAHLFEHLMFEGSTNVGSGEHMRIVQDSGGAVNATTSTERTTYIQTVSAEQLELVLYLEADRLGGLLDAVTQEALDKQRDVVRNERRQRYDNQPYGTAHERLYSLLYPAGHPYHHMPIGSMDDLAAASLEDVHAFFRSFYAPNNAVLTIVGDVDPDQAVELVTKHLGHLPANGDIPPAPSATLDAPLPAPVRVVVDEEKVPAPAVFAAYRAPVDGDPALDHLQLASTILSTGRASVFQRELVRAELAQQATVGLDRRCVGASAALVVVLGQQGIAPSRLEAVVSAEFSRLATEGPSDLELSRAKSMSERGWLDRVSSLEGRAEELSRCTNAYGDPGRINDGIEELRAATAADVSAAVAKYLVAAHPVTLEYQPARPEVAA